MIEPFTLTLSCPERPGIVHAVTAFLVEHGCDIVEHQQFDDPISGPLFLRTAFVSARDDRRRRPVAAFAAVAAEFGMAYQFTGDRRSGCW